MIRLPAFFLAHGCALSADRAGNKKSGGGCGCTNAIVHTRNLYYYNRPGRVCQPYAYRQNSTKMQVHAGGIFGIAGKTCIPCIRRAGCVLARRTHRGRRAPYPFTCRCRVGLVFVLHGGAGQTVGHPANPARRTPLPGGIYASPTNTRYRVHNPKPVAL